MTPPVSFAAYAGAAIAEADPMKTGWAAWTFTLAGFLLPYMFVYNNSLLFIGSPVIIILTVATFPVGIICQGAAIIGYFVAQLLFRERILLFAAAFLLIKPGWITDIVGILCVVLCLFLQFRRTEGTAVQEVVG